MRHQPFADWHRLQLFELEHRCEQNTTLLFCFPLHRALVSSDLPADGAEIVSAEGPQSDVLNNVAENHLFHHLQKAGDWVGAH